MCLLIFFGESAPLLQDRVKATEKGDVTRIEQNRILPIGVVPDGLLNKDQAVLGVIDDPHVDSIRHCEYCRRMCTV